MMIFPRRHPELAFILAFILSVTSAYQNDTCYWPNGKTAPNYISCKETVADGVSTCCSQGDICTINGYCVGNAGVFYRGGCTDQSWTSNLCPALCATDPTDSFANFYPCNPGVFSAHNWTCANNGCDGSTFTFIPGSIFVPELQAGTPTKTTTVATCSATSTASTPPTISSCPTTSTASTPPIISSCPTDNKNITRVGLGLGVALAITAVTGLMGFLIERRKRKVAENLATRTRPQWSGYDQREHPVRPEVSGRMVQEAASQPVHEIGRGSRAAPNAFF